MLSFFSRSSFYQKSVFILLTFISFSCSTPPKLGTTSPSFSQDIFTYLYKNRQRLNLCQGEIDQEMAQKNLKIYAINTQTHLIEFLCFLGAYQGNYQYFLYQEKNGKALITSLTFDIFEENSPQKNHKITVNSMGGLSRYDPLNNTLEIVTKYRGLGDCGSFGKYQWEQNHFKLVEYRQKANCDGQYIAPENYAKIYP